MAAGLSESADPGWPGVSAWGSERGGGSRARGYLSLGEDSIGLRPLPPTPKREALRITIERGLRRFSTLTLRRTLKPRSFMSATPQTSYKTILRPENASADLRQGARGASRDPKTTPGEPPERPGAPSEPPSGTPGRPGEPPRPDIANRSRGNTISTAPPGAPSRSHLLFSPQPPDI